MENLKRTRLRQERSGNVQLPGPAGRLQHRHGERLNVSGVEVAGLHGADLLLGTVSFGVIPNRLSSRSCFRRRAKLGSDRAFVCLQNTPFILRMVSTKLDQAHARLRDRTVAMQPPLNTTVLKAFRVGGESDTATKIAVSLFRFRPWVLHRFEMRRVTRRKTRWRLLTTIARRPFYPFLRVLLRTRLRLGPGIRRGRRGRGRRTTV